MIIINSDDFGVSPSINNATYMAFSKGLISSTTTLVNFEEGLIDAVDYLESGKIDSNSVGIHLNLTEGTPLTKKIRDNKIFCENGVFSFSRTSSSIFKLDASSKQSVYEELNAQMNQFIAKFGFLPSHIDSHHHIHTEWAIAQCVMDLAKKHKIKSIRLTRNIGKLGNFKKKVYKTILNKYINYRGFKTTDKFGSVDDLVFSEIHPGKNYEIMVHAKMSQNGKEIVDLDNENLHQKLMELFKNSTWKISNYNQL